MPRGISIYDEARVQGRLWAPPRGTQLIPPASASDFDNASDWQRTTGSFTFTPNAVRAPDPTQGACQITVTGSATLDRRIQSIAGGTAAKTFMAVCWVMSATGSPQTLQLKNTQGAVANNFLTITALSYWQEFLFPVTNGGNAGDASEYVGFNSSNAFSIYAWNYRLYDITGITQFERSRLPGWSGWGQGLQAFLPVTDPFAKRPPLIGG